MPTEHRHFSKHSNHKTALLSTVKHDPSKNGCFEGIEGLVLRHNKLYFKKQLIAEYEPISPKSYQIGLYKGSIYVIKEIKEVIRNLDEKHYCIVTNCGACM